MMRPSFSFTRGFAVPSIKKLAPSFRAHPCACSCRHSKSASSSHLFPNGRMKNWHKSTYRHFNSCSKTGFYLSTTVFQIGRSASRSCSRPSPVATKSRCNQEPDLIYVKEAINKFHQTYQKLCAKEMSSSGRISASSSMNGEQNNLLHAATDLVRIASKLKRATPGPSGLSSHLDPWSQDISTRNSLDQITLDVCNFGQYYNVRQPPTTRIPTSKSCNELLDAAETRPDRDAIGVLWRSLGEMVIGAASMSDTQADQIMTVVHLILAEMHSLDLVPSGIYGYEDADTPKARRKPPYLHILGARMMATMSDASWKFEEIGRAVGTDSSNSSFEDAQGDGPDSRIRKLQPSLWLEFILWSCVSQGYFVQATKLLSASCLTQKEKGWTLLNWDQVLELQTDHHKRQQSWFDRVMTLVEGYNEEPPLIEMPPKTLSSEVCAAVLEGLLSLPSDTDGIRSARRLAFSVYGLSACGNGHDLSKLALNSFLHRLSATSDLDSSIIASFLSEGNGNATVLPNRPPRVQHDSFTSMEEDTSISLSEAFMQSLALLPTNQLVSNFDSQVLRGNLREALSSFEQLRTLQRHKTDTMALGTTTGSETDRYAAMKAVPDAMGRSHAADIDTNDLCFLAVPGFSMSSFLQLVTASKDLQFVRELLYGDGLMLQSNARDPTFQPALLKAAVARSDKVLLKQVVEAFSADFDSLPDTVLYAVYETQISLRKFPAARRLLEYLRDTRQLSLTPRLVTLTACEYLCLVRNSGDGNSQVRQAWKLLRAILDGAYLPKRDPSKPPDYTQHRQLLQLERILQTADTSFTEGRGKTVLSSLNSLNDPVEIPADAFNPLLQTVLNSHGVPAACGLFEAWCDPTLHKLELAQSHQGIPLIESRFIDEKVVQPSLETVRIILNVALEELQAWRQEPSRERIKSTDPDRRLLRWVENTENIESTTRTQTSLSTHAPHHDLLEWGAQILRQMGLDEFAINEVIPGTYPQGE